MAVAIATVGGAMYRQLRLVLACMAVGVTPGWWDGGSGSKIEQKPDRTTWEEYTEWIYNQSLASNTTLADLVGLNASGWDGTGGFGRCATP